MPVGFRKGLLGFNCEDVMGYIEKSQKEFSQKEITMNEKIEQLNDSLFEAREERLKLSMEKDKIQHELAEFTEKYDNIQKLSENIGKLYLVAQANAKAIMNNTHHSAEIVKEEINNNISSIDYAHNSFAQLRENILNTTTEFINEIDSLTDSLNIAKSKIQANDDNSSSADKSFNELYNGVITK